VEGIRGQATKTRNSTGSPFRSFVACPRISPEFNKQLNTSIVDPAFIARVRKKLALDQRQAAAILGGGTNAFSRYENGKTKPPLALVKLFMVLDRHPNLLNEVRAGR
jgi:putative zinc finger/helix-turn-helix YgiT family protein